MNNKYAVKFQTVLKYSSFIPLKYAVTNINSYVIMFTSKLN